MRGNITQEERDQIARDLAEQRRKESKPHISSDVEIVRGHFRNPGMFPDGAEAFERLVEQLETLRGAARVVVQEFAADNPFVGYSVEALADVLGEPNPMRGAPNPAKEHDA